MEDAQKAGNARRLFQLIRAAGTRKPPVSETIKHQNGTTISSKEERLDRWAEYFEQQLSCSPAGTHLERNCQSCFVALCGNHREISLTPVVTRLLASILFRRLTVAREILTREQQAGFRPGRGCVDQIFTLRQEWPLRSDDVRLLQVFDHQCLRSPAGFGWLQRVSNEVTRKRVFYCAADTSLRERIHHHRLRWLGHVVHTPKHRLRVLLKIPSEWRKLRGGQRTTKQKSVKEITKSFDVVGVVRLPGWGPSDHTCAWLGTLQERAVNRCQWRSCRQFPDCLIERLEV
ncbi:LOW QUALITY PROTEIN: hypothetical protein T265_13208 [Opisthorchis viverrini]|uniref:Reverse transcriptase domain-containing protein n=1 Tax=Opisthorchis viverrini TaxID=6198 RepID=A0A075A3V3_OPIVI|nr:LOW QUALITY PROTEIN: hypothetical protein T265_13208 [Opisthorchis viverrini]KER30225.1 LOW QUALITY PROTEIN: hypothetical protein T265_13208 [Opisthorchis viverrini]